MTKKHHVRIGKDPERLNRGFWDEDADDYQAEHEAQLDVDTMGWGVWDLPETELKVLGDVNGLDVLEYGCGAAQWAIKLARVGASMTGLDQSRGQLGHAAAKIAAAAVSVQLVCASATAVPLADESFDIVFCDHGAMSFCDPYRTVPEVARLLRPDGMFAFNISTLLRNLCYPPGDPDAPVTRRLHAKWFGARAFDWGDGTIDFQIPHGEWISLFRENAFVVEDLLELRPPKHAKSTYGDYIDHGWARRWPAEEIWRARKL
jgi:SAM-dependent methyltransferase